MNKWRKKTEGSPGKRTLKLEVMLVFSYRKQQRSQLTLRSSLPKSTDSKADLDTLSSASGGHSMNQSIVQQLTTDGNIRQRDRNAFPTGLMHSTMCRLFLTNTASK